MYDPQQFDMDDHPQIQFVDEDSSENISSPDDPEDSAPSPISLNDNGEDNNSAPDNPANSSPDNLNTARED